MEPRWMLMSRGLTEKKLADYLRAGNIDQAFLNGIAMLLDPPAHKYPLYRLRVVRGKAHRPNGVTFDEVALVDDLRTLEASDLTRGERKAGRLDIFKKYGVSERTARAACKRADELDAVWEMMQSKYAADK